MATASAPAIFSFLSTTSKMSGAGRWRKRGAFNNAIGRSRGGQTTKIHALTDEIGRPHAIVITAGNVHDLEGARRLLERGHRPKRLLADRAYDARSLREMLEQRRIKAV